MFSNGGCADSISLLRPVTGLEIMQTLVAGASLLAQFSNNATRHFPEIATQRRENFPAKSNSRKTLQYLSRECAKGSMEYLKAAQSICCQ